MNFSSDLPSINEASRPVWNLPDGISAENPNGMGQHLIQVHHHVRFETSRLVAAVADVISGNGSADAARDALKSLSVRQNFPGLGGFCSGYCELLTIHHTIEDRNLFPGLEAVDPTLGPVLKKLFQEHEVVSELIVLLNDALAAAPGGTSLERLKAVSDSLTTQLISHLDYEEAQLVPALDAYSRA